MYSVFCATREGSPETPKKKRPMALNISLFWEGCEGERITAV